MGWVNSTDLLFSASKTAADNVNSYVLDLTSPFANLPSNSQGLPHFFRPPASPGWLQDIDVYMDNLLPPAQGNTAQKKMVLELTL